MPRIWKLIIVSIITRTCTLAHSVIKLLSTFSKTLIFFPSLNNVFPHFLSDKCYRDWKAGVSTLGDKEAAATLVGPLSMAVVVTRSHRGHIIWVDAGSGSQLWGEMMVGGPTFMALSSSTSLCSLLFCSVNEPNHLFMYSHSISVCFSLLLPVTLHDQIRIKKLASAYCSFNWCFSSYSKMVVSQCFLSVINAYIFLFSNF